MYVFYVINKSKFITAFYTRVKLIYETQLSLNNLTSSVQIKLYTIGFQFSIYSKTLHFYQTYDGVRIISNVYALKNEFSVVTAIEVGIFTYYP